jgi:hypothetical protein
MGLFGDRVLLLAEQRLIEAELQNLSPSQLRRVITPLSSRSARAARRSRRSQPGNAPVRFDLLQDISEMVRTVALFDLDKADVAAIAHYYQRLRTYGRLDAARSLRQSFQVIMKYCYPSFRPLFLEQLRHFPAARRQFFELERGVGLSDRFSP